MNRRHFIKIGSVATSLMIGAKNCFSAFVISRTNPAVYHGELGLRTLISDIKGDLREVSEYFQNSPPTPKTWKRFNFIVSELLRIKYVSAGFIYNFTIINDETTNSPEFLNNKGIMTGYINIRPNNRIEQITIDFMFFEK